jgi:hypothetical protein
MCVRFIRFTWLISFSFVVLIYFILVVFLQDPDQVVGVKWLHIFKLKVELLLFGRGFLLSFNSKLWILGIRSEQGSRVHPETFQRVWHLCHACGLLVIHRKLLPWLRLRLHLLLVGRLHESKIKGIVPLLLHGLWLLAVRLEHVHVIIILHWSVRILLCTE